MNEQELKEAIERVDKSLASCRIGHAQNNTNPNQEEKDIELLLSLAQSYLSANMELPERKEIREHDSLSKPKTSELWLIERMKP